MNRWQFSLRGLFVLVTAAAVLAVLWRYQILQRSWLAFAFVAFACGYTWFSVRLWPQMAPAPESLPNGQARHRRYAVGCGVIMAVLAAIALIDLAIVRLSQWRWW